MSISAASPARRIEFASRRGVGARPGRASRARRAPSPIQASARAATTSPTDRGSTRLETRLAQTMPRRDLLVRASAVIEHRRRVGDGRKPDQRRRVAAEQERVGARRAVEQREIEAHRRPRAPVRRPAARALREVGTRTTAAVAPISVPSTRRPPSSASRPTAAANRCRRLPSPNRGGAATWQAEVDGQHGGREGLDRESPVPPPGNVMSPGFACVIEPGAGWGGRLVWGGGVAARSRPHLVGRSIARDAFAFATTASRELQPPFQR